RTLQPAERQPGARAEQCLWHRLAAANGGFAGAVCQIRIATELLKEAGMAADRERHQASFSRREALSLLGAAAGTCLTSALGDLGPVAAAAAQTAGPARQAARFPNGAIIRTLLKDTPPDQIGSGSILFHE